MAYRRTSHRGAAWRFGLAAAVLGALGLLLMLSTPRRSAANLAPAQTSANPDYVVLAWNDLGMHCYNANFKYISILPPANTVWAQVIRLGDPPQIVTEGVIVTYAVEDNTFSVGKSNFWDYADELGWNVQPNVGVFGFGMSGQMHLANSGDHFVAEGIPLTEYTDSAYLANPSNPTPQPYQLGIVQVWDAATGGLLAETHPTLPVSTEMNCDDCHYDGGVESISTGSVELNILTLHDSENANEYPAGTRYGNNLVANAPVQCADCHGSNALGILGVADLEDVSIAMHGKHAEEMPNPDTQEACYQCHPGPETECLRGVMSTEHGMTCIDCHGGMAEIAANPQPWLNEPRCDDAGCHDNGLYDQNNDLYRLSTGHGGVYCEGCHDSPHAIAPSRVVTDAIKFIGWQGHNGPVDSCVVCHETVPASAGPHELLAPDVTAFTFQPASQTALVATDESMTYRHQLRNTGNMTDSYDLVWSSSQGWATVTFEAPGGSTVLPVELTAGEWLTVTTTVSVPAGPIAPGVFETTTITVTSTTSPTLVAGVVDITRVVQVRVYLPIVMR